MVFDRTWKQLRGSNKTELSQEEHLEAVLEAMADHPFLISSPDMARQVAAFRIRLLELARSGGEQIDLGIIHVFRVIGDGVVTEGLVLDSVVIHLHLRGL